MGLMLIRGHGPYHDRKSVMGYKRIVEFGRKLVLEFGCVLSAWEVSHQRPEGDFFPY